MEQTVQERALVVETAAAESLMQAALMLVEVQPHCQPREVQALGVALHDAYELRIEIVLGQHPHVRVVCVDTEGADCVLLRRLDLTRGGALN